MRKTVLAAIAALMTAHAGSASADPADAMANPNFAGLWEDVEVGSMLLDIRPNGGQYNIVSFTGNEKDYVRCFFTTGFKQGSVAVLAENPPSKCEAVTVDAAGNETVRAEAPTQIGELHIRAQDGALLESGEDGEGGTIYIVYKRRQ